MLLLRPDRGAEGRGLYRLARDEATGLRMYCYNNAWHTGWFIIDPEVYCFDKNGVAYDGKVTLYGKQFVFDDGVVVSGPTGFVKRDDGKTLYFENGRIASGWKDIGNATYYFETFDLGDDFGVRYTGPPPDRQNLVRVRCGWPSV